jgi:acetyl-CoA carboxylase biotin carboxyl carrier protein
MTIDEIKELIHVVFETGIAELEVQRGENRVRIRRTSIAPAAQEVVLPTAIPVVAAPQHAAAVVRDSVAASLTDLSAAAVAPARAATPSEDDRNVLVKSPIVGTYYDSPSPGVPSFVKIGDRVEAGQVLCIIESMKLMNEIESETAGTVVAKYIENGRPVEYGESLFSIRPF